MRKHGMKVAVGALLLALFLFARTQISGPLVTQAPAAVEDGISVYFSPRGGCEAAIVQQIGRATRSIDVQAYSFTSQGIARALADAQSRGVRVRAVLDKTAAGEHYSGATYLMNHGIATYVDGQHPIAHNKIIIIDAQTVITGSFNFTKQAEEQNAENLLVIEGKPAIAAAYLSNFEEHLGHSQRYTGIPGRSAPAWEDAGPDHG